MQERTSDATDVSLISHVLLSCFVVLFVKKHNADRREGVWKEKKDISKVSLYVMRGKSVVRGKGRFHRKGCI